MPNVEDTQEICNTQYPTFRMLIYKSNFATYEIAFDGAFFRNIYMYMTLNNLACVNNFIWEHT